MDPEDIKISAETSRLLRQAQLESSRPVAVLGERIEAAAIKVKDVICFVERPGRHHDVFYAMARAGFDDRIGPEQQGFVTSVGRFVGREEARQIASDSDQLIKSDKDSTGIPIVRHSDQLFSEDVW